MTIRDMYTGVCFLETWDGSAYSKEGYACERGWDGPEAAKKKAVPCTFQLLQLPCFEAHAIGLSIKVLTGQKYRVLLFNARWWNPYAGHHSIAHTTGVVHQVLEYWVRYDERRTEMRRDEKRLEHNTWLDTKLLPAGFFQRTTDWSFSFEFDIEHFNISPCIVAIPKIFNLPFVSIFISHRHKLDGR